MAHRDLMNMGAMMLGLGMGLEDRPMRRDPPRKKVHPKGPTNKRAKVKAARKQRRGK